MNFLKIGKGVALFLPFYRQCFTSDAVHTPLRNRALKIFFIVILFLSMSAFAYISV